MLEQLAAEGTHGVDPTPVVDLGARRRRLAGGLLVAAAAVVVAGLGIGQLIGPKEADDSGTAAASAESPLDGAADAGTRRSPTSRPARTRCRTVRWLPSR